MVVRFHLPVTALVKYLAIVTGDTVDSGTSCATSQPKKGFSERSRLTIVASANPLSHLRKVRNWCSGGCKVTTLLVQRVLIGTCGFSFRKKNPPSMPLAFPQPRAIMSQGYADSCL